MRRTHRMLGLILALCCMAFPTHAAETAADTDITRDSLYWRLCAFGVITEEDGLAYEETVSRGDFTKYVVRISGMESTLTEVQDDAPLFSDVPADHENFKYIQAARRLGIISGGAAFEPDAPVTRAQACKMLLGVLGYGAIAQGRGGYPMGYLAVAAETGLLRGCGENTENVTPAVLVRLLANTLDAAPLEQTAVGTETTYETAHGSTLLSRNFDIYETTGIVDADPYTTLLGESTIAPGSVGVGGEAYLDPQGYADGLLGRNIRVYYREEAGADQREVVYAEENTQRNEIIAVLPENILDSTTADTFVYFDQDHARRMEKLIPKSASLIYNGKLRGIEPELLHPREGKVTLIDNDGDGMVDVVHVTSYRVVVVGGVSPSTGTVSDKLGGESIVLDPNDKSLDVDVTIDGKKASISQLREWNVVFYAAAEGGGRSKKTLVASTAAVEGMVEAVGEDTVTIGGKEYEASAVLGTLPEAGMYAVFYLDPMGRIAAKESSKDIVYGYLNKLHQNAMGAVQARIFTENNRWVTLEFQGKVKYNGDSVSAADCFAALGGGNADAYRQLITYRVSDGAKIVELNTAQKVEEPWSDEENKMIENNVFRLSREIASAKFRLSTQSFDGDISLGADTKIFSIPKQTAADSAEEKEFGIISSASFGRDKTYTSIYAYDADKLAKAKACVVVDKSLEVDNTEKLASVMIVHAVNEASNDSGERIYAISGLYSQYPVKFFTKDKSVVDDIGGLQEGDVVQFVFDDLGDVVKVEVVYRVADGAEQKFLKNNLYDVNTFVAGRVRRVDVAQQRIVIEYGAGANVVLSLAKVSGVYQFDAAADQDMTTIVSVNDVQEGDWLVAGARYFEIGDIVLIR